MGKSEQVSQQRNHRCSGADNQSIQENRDHLCHTLYSWMFTGGSGSGVGSGTHTSLIGEQAAFHALNDTRSRKAACHGGEVERILENGGNHAANLTNVHNNADQAKNDICGGRNRNQNRGLPSNAADTAEDNKPHQNNQDNTKNSVPDGAAIVLNIVF